MRDLVLHQTTWSQEQQRAILEYCSTDVVSLAALFRRMAPRLEIRDEQRVFVCRKRRRLAV
jgi:hypothetical protein